MINSQIIKIASKSNNAGLKNKFTHRSSVKNSICGDFIKVEFIADKIKVKSMRYETESCILCEASASLLSKKIKDKNINDLKKEILEFKRYLKKKDNNFPRRFKDFMQLIDKDNINRLNCVILPMDAYLKAFNINNL